MRANPNKLRKCSSANHFKLDFNPSELKMGVSAVDSIPIRQPLPKHLEKSKSKKKVIEEKPKNTGELEIIASLSSQIKSLQRENQLLKK